MQEVTFDSQLLADGHLDCPKQYAHPGAQFRVIVSFPGEHSETPSRPFGLCKGQFKVPDDFDSPLPEHILQEFES